MAKLLKLRLGVADDPTALQPNLNDCLSAMLQHAEDLMADVLDGLAVAAGSTGPKRLPALQTTEIQQVVRDLNAQCGPVSSTFRERLTAIVYEGGGKDQVHATALRFEDLQLFADSDLDQSIEVAQAQQEVSLCVDDELPALDSLISTLLGWRTIQAGLNPLRPDVFVRALQACLSEHVRAAPVREALIVPAAGLLGVQLARLYRELSDWLRSCGIEPAVPVGGRLYQGSGASGKAVNDSAAKTLLTLDRLRHLLAGDFDVPKARDDLYTVPASMSLLQEMKQVDTLVQKLQRQPRPPAENKSSGAVAGDDTVSPRLGLQLGAQVVQLMFENLAQDRRLMPEFKRQLQLMESALFTLAQHDSRFFSDRNHPARQFLDRMTQRSLAFSAESDEGWGRFLTSIQDSVQWLDSKVVDAELFGELLDHLQVRWSEHDVVLRARRETAARALLHAEQRNLLAQKLASEFGEALQSYDVAPVVSDFLKGSWAQVVAEAQLSCVDGSDDPYGYRALVDELIWSVQVGTVVRGRSQRVAQMIPELLSLLRDGLKRIDYPPELTTRFFDHLIKLHEDALNEGRERPEVARPGAGESAAVPMEADATPALPAAQAQPVPAPARRRAAPAPPPPTDPDPWVNDSEAQESGFQDVDSYLPDQARQADASQVRPPEPPPEPVGAAELRTGTWLELIVNGNWLRVQLTWASPHATLFMFTSQAGTAHSMSRRTLERLRGQGMMRVIADRTVVDDAFDEVAQAALRNSLDAKL
jgi:hypothetical protein